MKPHHEPVAAASGRPWALAGDPAAPLHAWAAPHQHPHFAPPPPLEAYDAFTAAPGPDADADADDGAETAVLRPSRVLGLAAGRGLHSSTSQLNVSAFGGIRGAYRGRLGVV